MSICIEKRDILAQCMAIMLLCTLPARAIVPEYRTQDTNPWARTIAHDNSKHDYNGLNSEMNDDFVTEMSIEGEVERIISKLEKSPETASKQRKELERLQIIMPDVSTSEQKKAFLDRLEALGITFRGPGFEVDTTEMLGEAQGLIDEITGIEAVTEKSEDLLLLTSSQVSRLFDLLQSIGTSPERDALLDQTHTFRSPLPEIFLERSSEHIVVDEADEAAMHMRLEEHNQRLDELKRRIDQLETEELVDAEKCDQYREQYEQLQRELELLQEQHTTCLLLTTNGNEHENDLEENEFMHEEQSNNHETNHEE